MKIVKFQDGTYGIKAGWWPFNGFLSRHTDNVYTRRKDVYDYCRFATLDKATNRLDQEISVSSWEEL